jgi:tRNA-dihydrouridine synthase B
VVNGDVVDAVSAREALAQSGADAVMIGRGAYGRPWLPAQIEAELAGRPFAAPGPEERLGIVLDHFRRSLAFYGEGLGLKMFKKHLGHYVEAAPWPADPAGRRQAKADLCRLDEAVAVERGLAALWSEPSTRLAA